MYEVTHCGVDGLNDLCIEARRHAWALDTHQALELIEAVVSAAKKVSGGYVDQLHLIVLGIYGGRCCADSSDLLNDTDQALAARREAARGRPFHRAHQRRPACRQQALARQGALYSRHGHPKPLQLENQRRQLRWARGPAPRRRRVAHLDGDRPWDEVGRDQLEVPLHRTACVAGQPGAPRCLQLLVVLPLDKEGVEQHHIPEPRVDERSAELVAERLQRRQVNALVEVVGRRILERAATLLQLIGQQPTRGRIHLLHAIVLAAPELEQQVACLAHRRLVAARLAQPRL